MRKEIANYIHVFFLFKIQFKLTERVIDGKRKDGRVYLFIGLLTKAYKQ
jgi:hypothetical protein